MSFVSVLISLPFSKQDDEDGVDPVRVNSVKGLGETCCPINPKASGEERFWCIDVRTWIESSEEFHCFSGDHQRRFFVFFSSSQAASSLLSHLYALRRIGALRLYGVAQSVVEPTRIWGDIQRCSDGDLVVTQGPTSPLPSGIPTYTVEINNACVTGCDISHIHLRCGWFSSARLVNPHIFKRLRFNDCLVNNGQPLGNGQTITFQYANTFSYPLSISSMHCS
ncbi:TPD1 protein homolog 1-like protein [Drosera capensis]